MTDTPLQTAFVAASETFQKSAADILKVLRCLGSVVREMQEAGMDISLEARPRNEGSPIAPIGNDMPLANGTLLISGTKAEFNLTRGSGFNVYLGGAKLSSDWVFSADEQKTKAAAERALLKAKAEIEAITACSVPADSNAGRKLDKPRPGILKT